MSKAQKKVSKVPNKKRKKNPVEHSQSSSDLFNNREIGWLNFNLRVLHEAQDKKNPLLERVRFLAIASSNLDEFFMKRVGGLKRQIAYGLSPKSSDGLSPRKQLLLISKALEPMLIQKNLLLDQLKIELADKGCQLVSYKQLKPNEKKTIRQYFKEQIFPILTPLSVDSGHPFPFISNLSISLGVSLLAPQASKDEKIFARVKIPKLVDQWIQLEDSQRFIHVNEVVKEFVGELFPSMKVIGTTFFKVTRNADSDREDDDTEDLLATIEEELRQRRFAEIVRVEFSDCTDTWLKSFLIKELEIKDEDIFDLVTSFDLTDLSDLVNMLAWPEHKFKSWSPVVPAHLIENTSVFSQIAQRDIFLHHPFESFSASVERFISEAAQDPDVLAIKMTLYRTGDNSPFIKSLIEAAENGKQVVCLIELKARFDEHRNIIWAQELERAGVHVVYGIVGLKIHAKTSLVVRKENKSVKTYAHLGTGNYNVTTSRFYTDVGLLTCDSRITNELIELFNYLTGKSMKADYQHLLIAPVNMFQKFKHLVLRETQHALNKKPAHIMAKFNNMEENDISLALYEASQAGVPVQLIVRGFCCLKPSLKKLSEKVEVQSTLGRFLEHSRIFYFRNGMADPLDGDFFIGSADWMYRNLHARVEVVTPIYDKSCKEQLYDILQSYWNDQAQSWTMKADGSYLKKSVLHQRHLGGIHADLMSRALNNKQSVTEDELNIEK